MLFLRVELLEAWVYCRELGALSCHVECLDAWETVAGGCLVCRIVSMCGMSLVIFLGDILKILSFPWIACGNTGNTLENTVFED